ncbi:GNAT family N-acetyltransferase [Pseudoalteromonas sp. SG45-5]|uniref:N-acetyltransferase domain-containing protein n=1 Tax=Pseudoalteromonas aliena TaxID=247523 RepID=A0A1Q2GZV8_9GAMM|nr:MULTISPECIES: GNAT family N-acetyltransferase [Pseudoalteromonas]AQQ00625.1 hypothetical protein B0W48_12900 [Pseudoalteromonas aliena]MBB1384153.1 GNAT family N-acetyltransferase [Pseudoalteromonas sp. SG45-5]MBB1392455.1 GNAT family N-acetyltransferase [Pseudoalteromonas sp. SG44-4]MBB1446730.1 GNAT family N-acetyltransferase [Pseudoalteromonas sp. SG41-6]
MKMNVLGTERLNLKLMHEGAAPQLYEQTCWGLWEITIKQSNVFIGYILVKPMDLFSELPDFSDIEIGWRLKQESWGNGYATEAASLMFNEIAKQPDIKKISATANKNNQASIKVMEKLGMQFIKNYIQKEESGDVPSVHYSKCIN